MFWPSSIYLIFLFDTFFYGKAQSISLFREIFQSFGATSLQRRNLPTPAANKCPGFGTKQSNGEVPVMLEQLVYKKDKPKFIIRSPEGSWILV